MAPQADVIKRDDLKIELYSAGRFFIVTGHHLDESPNEIREAPRLIDRLVRLHADTPKPGKAEAPHKANGHARPTGDDFWHNVNAAALAHCDKWVPVLHPTARKEDGTGAWRVYSLDLGRDREEDVSYHAAGIQDFGDEHGMTAVDAVLRFGSAPDATAAAFWLCRQIGVEPVSLGWRGGQTGPRQKGREPESEPASGPHEDDQATLAAEALDTTERGAVTKSELNVRRCLAKAGVRLSYDAFSRQRLIHGQPGYGPDLTDGAIDALWIGFEREHKVRFSREHLAAVIRVEAHAHTFHPVLDYLDGLKWDRVPRLDRWLGTHAGAADSPLVQQFGRLTLIGAVRRVRRPGSKFDTMLVLEGPEGRNKSTLFETLASPGWFSDDAPLHAEARETIERLRGKWIIEAADLAAVRRTDVERLKAFLARKIDEATLKYERENTKAPRACIFVGTTNNSEYLQSKTGNRRFWPVRVGKIDIAALQRDRDQLWAEAAHYERLGASIVLPEHLWGDAREEQEKRREGDAWEGAIAAWLDQKQRSTNPLVTPAEVAQQALALQLRDLDGRSQARITDAMRLAGWSKDAGKIVRGLRYWGPSNG